jgi:hypothetical protein
MAESSGRALIAVRTHRARIAVLLMIGLASGFAAVVQPAGARPPRAHGARTQSVDDTAHLHLLKSSGSLLYEEGTTSGGISGKMRANLNIGATFTGSFTIYAKGGGTLKGHGTATPHGSGRYESFSGSMVITGGSGRYAHAHGSGGLFGTFDRESYAFVVQTTGKLTY